jgi:hypothetical protein
MHLSIYLQLLQANQLYLKRRIDMASHTTIVLSTIPQHPKESICDGKKLFGLGTTITNLITISSPMGRSQWKREETTSISIILN